MYYYYSQKRFASEDGKGGFVKEFLQQTHHGDGKGVDLLLSNIIHNIVK